MCSLEQRIAAGQDAEVLGKLKAEFVDMSELPDLRSQMPQLNEVHTVHDCAAIHRTHSRALPRGQGPNR
jgi:hypothetical protein